MARVAINTGAAANDGTGDTLRAAGGIINSNFLEIYTHLGAGSTTTLSAPVWNTTSAGINTLRNVGVGTTNPRFTLEVGAVGASGTSLYVNGDARITGIVTIGTSSITLNGSSNTINVGTGITINGSTGIISATSIVVGGTTLTGAAVTRIEAGSGISVNQNTGQVTITATGGGGSSQWVSTAAGIHTLSNVGIGTTNPTSALTVTGNGTFTGVVTATTFVGALTGTATTATLATNAQGLTGTPDITVNKIVAGLTSSIIPFYWENFSDLPSFSTYHGAFAHVHQTGKAYYAHTRWVELVNTEASGVVGTGTEKYNIGVVTTSSLTVSGVTTSGGVNVTTGNDYKINATSVLSSTTLGSGVVNSSLTSVGTLTNLNVGNINSTGILTAISGNFSGIITSSSANISGILTSGTHNVTSGNTYQINGTTVLSNNTLGSGVVNSSLTSVGTLNQLNVSGVSTVGIVTGATYYGDASNVVDGRWTLGANGSSDYTFTGIGFTQTTNDPVLYLARGRVYEFVNNSGGSHPFQIRSSNGGSAYNDGVTNNGAASGTIRFEVPFSAPNTLYYQCTSHSGMGNTISVYPNTI